NRDPKLVRKIGEATALEVRATGIQYAFAPCIAVCRDPRWGRCYESYSEDHKVVQAMTEIIPGLQGEIPANSRKGVPYVAGKKKVVACAKHFVGDGGTTKGIDENNTVISRHGLLSIHMPAYYNSIIKGVASVMVSYSSWNGEKMHANHNLVTDFLKNTLRFRGFVISDMEGIDRITSPPHANYSYSIYAGVTAGIDMVMLPYNFTEFIDGLTTQVKKNIIPMSRIDDAVKRILRVKFVMGLFENPLADNSLANQIGNQKHRNLAREAVRKSLVLLKNGENADEPLLPLPKKAKKILVAGSHADNLGYQCGGWTIEWQGLSGNNITKGTTILIAIKNTVDKDTEVVFSILLIMYDITLIDIPHNMCYLLILAVVMLQVMLPYNFTEFIDGLTTQVKKNIIPMSRIDDAVKRILRVKFVMGLFENPLADNSLANQIGNQKHRNLAREAVRKSLVLLKNGENADEPLLPLPKKAKKILVAGSHADNLGYQCGGWTIEWQGLSGNNINVTQPVVAPHASCILHSPIGNSIRYRKIVGTTKGICGDVFGLNLYGFGYDRSEDNYVVLQIYLSKADPSHRALLYYVNDDS
ncbi:uncharacterized protein LOC109792572, partial [Cajanus cajan]|uniref:uncharacterized protein LOC109792572 n=1 Tax=Cajanus cajan TaxID=3821 RepID=UPI0010FB762E